MKIAIMGAHGVGKTSLVQAMASTGRFHAVAPKPMHNPEPSQIKSLQDCSIEEVIRLSQRRYSERVQQESSSESFVSDGSVLHEWTYALTRLQLGLHPSEQTIPATGPRQDTQRELIGDFIMESLLYARETYDILFFIPVEFPLPREEAPISDRFQREASNLLRSQVVLADRPFHILEGTLPERLIQVEKVLVRT